MQTRSDLSDFKVWLRKRVPRGLPALVLGVTLCGALISAGCGGQTSAGNAPPASGGPPATPAAAVTLCDNPAPGCPPASNFSLSTSREVDIFVAWSNVPAGSHTQKLNLRLPRGELYQTLESSFLIDDSLVVGFATAMCTLPVAGTFITQRQLTGDWTLEVVLDDQSMASTVFHFDP